MASYRKFFKGLGLKNGYGCALDADQFLLLKLVENATYSFT
jgi:hypothetical protein